MKDANTRLQVGDIVENILSGAQMTIIHITSDKVFNQEIFHCAYFDKKYFMEIEIFQPEEIRFPSSSKDVERKESDMNISDMNIQDRVLCKHQVNSDKPVMKVTGLYPTSIPHVICKWLTLDGEIQTEILPLTALKKAD
ncbi:hypothetical protein [Xanthocytophaga flava]|uniref:hypothetical protein n=1 Tax=Xanthocytophaga flava TaxID=3048013 RepID=UPI0028D4C699|nr:hypothetical protein [Xanthocytophaga flavus]MDJ1467613.1 hypothetical protein [Xanthocytophaga flavus]